MTPEEHQMLVETRDLAERNAAILKSIQKTNRINLVFKVLYWVVIIGVSFGAFYVIQPYVDTLRASLGTLNGY